MKIKKKKKTSKTDFELFLISHSLSLQKVCLTYFYFSLQEYKSEPISYSLCLNNATQPGKVLNGLNAWQSEIFTELQLKDSFKLLDGI